MQQTASVCPPSVLKEAVLCPQYCHSDSTFCSLNFQLLTVVGHCLWNPEQELFQPCGKVLTEANNIILFDTLTETEKSLQFGLMWEEVQHAFSLPLSAVSAWNWAHCVGSMSYLYTHRNMESQWHKYHSFSLKEFHCEEGKKKLLKLSIAFLHCCVTVHIQFWHVLKKANKINNITKINVVVADSLDFFITAKIPSPSFA